MGCMSSKSSPSIEPEKRPAPEISWPTKCYRNPGVLPSTLAIGYPYPYPDGYPNTAPPFPIPDNTTCNCRKLEAEDSFGDCCDALHALTSCDAARRGAAAAQSPGRILKVSSSRGSRS